MDIPYEQINKDTLTRMIEHFIAREGTDYGEKLYTMEEKVADVMHSLETGRAKITFHPETKSCDVVATKAF
jgi:uncharacterized protein YheU (UPF0270 family)